MNQEWSCGFKDSSELQKLTFEHDNFGLIPPTTKRASALCFPTFLPSLRVSRQARFLRSWAVAFKGLGIF